MTGARRILCGLVLACTGCGGIWNAGDLQLWVIEQAEKKGCAPGSVVLEDWYREEPEGNIWHGRCKTGAGAERSVAIPVDAVWTPSGQ